MKQMGFEFDTKADVKADTKAETKGDVKADVKADTESNGQSYGQQTAMQVDPKEDGVIEDSHVFTVSELNKNIRSILEGKFSDIWLQGEISNFKPHTSGHFYFSLKDKNSQMSAVMFKGFNSRLKFRPKDGQEVLIRGKITVYEPRGSYQIFCEVMEPMGAGALQLAFEQLKSKLQGEGLFLAERKRKLPTLPSHIALVTSPTGAAVRDMLNVLQRRFKGAEITIVPVLVQGDKAAASIVGGIQSANLLKGVDVIIVGRGGGSIEDLWAFNEEIVARAIVASDKPIISAVGHEVDFTIADFVADLRAPTPSAAAELVTQNAEDILSRIQLQKRRLWNLLQSHLKSREQHVQNLNKRLIDPRRKLQDLIIRCDELTFRLEQSVLRSLETRRAHISLARQKLGRPADRLEKFSQQVVFLCSRLQFFIESQLKIKRAELNKQMAVMDSLSPLRVVERGYSIVKKEGQVVKNSEQLRSGDQLEVIFAKGQAEVVVNKLVSKRSL